MICPGKIVVIQVCNENSVIDDNFDVKLNGTYIGSLDLNSASQVGSVFVGANTEYNIAAPDFLCPLENMVYYLFDDSILNIGTNTLDMINTQSNGWANYGTVGIRVYDLIDNELVNPSVVADLIYNGGDGDSFNFSFDFTCDPSGGGGSSTSSTTTSPSTTSSTTTSPSTSCIPCYPAIPPYLKPPKIPIPTTLNKKNYRVNLPNFRNINNLNVSITTTTPTPTTTTTTTTPTPTTTTSTTTIPECKECKILKF